MAVITLHQCARALLMISLALCGCTQNHSDAVTPEFVAAPVVARPVHAYGLVHRETTGITSFILLDGKAVAVMFRSDSNPEALQTLYALKPEVYLPNSQGKGIRLVGQFYEGVSRTPGGQSRAEIENYHKFRLDRWYMPTPFIQWRGMEEMGGSPSTHLRQHLTGNDFEGLRLNPAALRQLQQLEKPR